MFACNGLIRRLVSESDYENYYVICKKKNFKTIETMYSDEDKISVVPIEDNADDEMREVAKQFLHIKGNIIRIGHENLDQHRNFDESFYEQLGYNIQDKFDWSKISRNKSIENECYNSEVSNEDYIFVHDMSSVGEFNLKIETEYDIFKPGQQNASEKYPWCVVDYLKVIENAKEIHCIDSSFLHMIDLIETKSPCFFHKIKNSQFPCLSEKWKVVNYNENC